jgi:hypothetical protein
MQEHVRAGGRRLLFAAVISVIAIFGVAATAAPAQAATAPGKFSTTQASCWVNVFAWVSTSPSFQGNLSSIVSCNTTVQKITQTMYVRDYYTGAVVATVGPVSQFNTTSGGIAYHWFCNQLSPRTLWGEVHGSVTELNGVVSNGTWSTQVLSC